MKKQWAILMIAIGAVGGLAVRAPAQCRCDLEEPLSVQRFVQERAAERAQGLRPGLFRDPRAPRFQMAPFVQKPAVTQKAVCAPCAPTVCAPAVKGQVYDPCGYDPCGYCRPARLIDVIRRLDTALRTILPGRRFGHTTCCGAHATYEVHVDPLYAEEVYWQPVAPRSPVPSRAVSPPLSSNREAPVPSPPAGRPPVAPPPVASPPVASPPTVEQPLQENPFRDDTLELAPPVEEPEGEAGQRNASRMSRLAFQERTHAAPVPRLVRPVTVEQVSEPQEPAVQPAAYWHQPVVSADSN